MPADKEEIRDRSDIVDVIGTYVALKRRGRNWLGLCPFHQEKTPSFNVSPETQTFRCFGCGSAGDVFKFIERYENMTFVEAAEFLARRAGLTFERQGGGGAERTSATERDSLAGINAAALAYFRKMLDKVAFARDYLRDRGLVHETIQRFQLGYAPNSFDGLLGYLHANRYDLTLAETAGLLGKGDSGDYYDKFRHRILFPIHDEQDRIVGFGGRAFGDDTPKYLNTGETPIFVKSRLLYGLPFARRKIAAEGRVLLMEGYMDVIAAHQAGFTNAVATLGTSLTEDHARKLARLMPTDPTVLLVYDADNAGIKATLRASELLEKEGVQVRVVRLPAGEDPDSLLKKSGGASEFQIAIDGALTRIDYLVEYAAAQRDMKDPQGRLDFLRNLYRILMQVRDPAVADVYLVRYAHLHPLAVHGAPSAVARMRVELDERRRGISRRESVPVQPSTTDDATASLTAQEQQLKIIQAMMPDADASRRQTTPSAKRQAIQNRYRQIRFAPPPRIVPPAAGTGGLTAVERAEREIIRALADPDWRGRVLKRVSADDFVTELGHQFYEFVQANEPALRSGEADLIRLLTHHKDEVFSAAILARLQDFTALVEKEAVSRSLEEQLAGMSDALLDQCIERLRRHHTERRLRAEVELLQSKPILTREDMERVRECQRLLRELKGSGSSTEPR